MITFKLTFLLSFNIIPEVSATKKKKTKTKKKIKLQTQMTESILQQNKDYELNTGKFITSVRIEYELFPKKIRYGIDISCWENIAKITTVDGFRYYRILKDGHLIWVPLTIHHFLKKVTDIELVNLHGHIIKFSITTAKKDTIEVCFLIMFLFSPQPTLLYCKKIEAKSENIVEYFEEDPNQSKKRAGKDETEELNIALKKCASDSTNSWLKFTDDTHSYMVYESISCLKTGSNIKYKEFNVSSNLIVTENVSAKKSKNKKSKKKKKQNVQKKGDPHFVLPAEVFFTDPDLAVYKLKDENHLITSGFIFLTVRNLMTREQKSSLNPFIIKLKSLNFLPADLLEESGYKKIYISLEIPSLAQYESSPRPIQENTYFDDCHAYFSKDTAKVKYLEFIRSHRVRVNINGIKGDNEMKPSLFGTKQEDSHFSQRLQPREASKILRTIDSPPKTQVVAVANFDISSLLKDVWTFREEVSCHHPDTLLHGFEKNVSRKFVDIYTAPEVNNGILETFMNKSPLLEGILTSAPTSLEMEFHFLAPQYATMYLQMTSYAYKRLFFTIYDRSLAQDILASVIQHNENIVGFNAILSNYVDSFDDKIKIEVKKPEKSAELLEFYETMQVKSEERFEEVIGDVVTGFMIDNGTETHIFIEGIRHGYVLEIWNKIHKANTDVAKVFLNSENDFASRLYDDFISTGIIKITLKKPLQDLFKIQDIYVEGSIPLPCYKALQKLNLLLQTDTLHKMLQFNLLPSSDELMNLNIEFGVPLRMYK